MAVTQKPRVPGAPEALVISGARTRGYNPTDVLGMVYLGMVSLLILAAGRQTPGWGRHLAVYAGLLGLVALLRFVPRRLPKVLQFLRESYTLFMLPAAYADLDWLNRIPGREFYDSTVLGWDRAVFGGHPHLFFRDLLPYTAVSEILHSCYLLYMALVPILGFTLYFQKREHAFRVLATTVTLTMYSCYAFFIFFPVQGPYHTFGQPQGTPGVIPGIVYGMIDRGSAIGTAFPSSHVAGAVTVAVMATWFSRKLSVLMVALAVGIGVATIYGGFHYAIDAVAGFVYGLLLSLIGPRIHAFLLRRVRIPHTHLRFPHLRFRWRNGRIRGEIRRHRAS